MDSEKTKVSGSLWPPEAIGTNRNGNFDNCLAFSFDPLRINKTQFLIQRKSIINF